MVARRRERLVAESAAALRGERCDEPVPARRRRGRVGGLPRPDRCLIAASILDSDLAKLGDEIRRAADGGADRIHLDVMDAHFVPNLTFGWKTIEAVRRATDLPFDAHLMIAEPSRWSPKFVEAGCDSITFHVEVGALARSGRRWRRSGRPARPRGCP